MENSSGGVTVVFNLFDLKLQLQKAIGSEVSWAEISRESGVNQNTLTSLLHNKARRVDLDTLEKLINYFNAQGLRITHADLFRTVEKAQ
jgi:hypothetical protein